MSRPRPWCGRSSITSPRSEGFRSCPEQKGSIENLVGWVKRSFFKQRRFLDDADLVAQLAEWDTEVNTQRPSRATGVIPALRLAEERPRLRPLKIAPADRALRLPVVVEPTWRIQAKTPLLAAAGVIASIGDLT
jgi:hypothetical protein